MSEYVIKHKSKRIWLDNSGGDAWDRVYSIRHARRFTLTEAYRVASAYGPGWDVLLAPVRSTSAKETK